MSGLLARTWIRWPWWSPTTLGSWSSLRALGSWPLAECPMVFDRLAVSFITSSSRSPNSW